MKRYTYIVSVFPNQLKLTSHMTCIAYHFRIIWRQVDIRDLRRYIFKQSIVRSNIFCNYSQVSIHQIELPVAFILFVHALLAFHTQK